jgi:hypothetical protein
MLPEELGQNQNFLRMSPGWLDCPTPPTRLDRPPQTEREKQQPRVNPQLCITRSPESPNGLQRNFENSWVTSWETSTYPKHSQSRGIEGIISLFQELEQLEKPPNRVRLKRDLGAKSPAKEAQGPHM